MRPKYQMLIFSLAAAIVAVAVWVSVGGPLFIPITDVLVRSHLGLPGIAVIPVSMVLTYLAVFTILAIIYWRRYGWWPWSRKVGLIAVALMTALLIAGPAWTQESLSLNGIVERSGQMDFGTALMVVVAFATLIFAGLVVIFWSSRTDSEGRGFWERMGS